MLPLDVPNLKIISLFKSHGIDENNISIAFMSDMDTSEQYRQIWILFDYNNKKIYRISEDGKDYDIFDCNIYNSSYMESFYATARILLVKHIENDNSDTSNEHFNKVSDSTVILCKCTNSYRSKMAVFMDVMERLLKGTEVSEKDPIFEAFNTRCPKCGKPYKDLNERVCDCSINKKNILLRIFSYFKPFRKQFITVMLCLFVTSVISIITPIFSGQILFDQVVSSPSFDQNGIQLTGKLHELKYVYIFAGILIVMGAVALLVSILQNRTNAHISQWVSSNMRNELFSKIQSLTYSYFNKNYSGGLINRVYSDTDTVKSFYVDGVPYLIMNIINMIGVTVFLFLINIKLTIILFIPVLIVFFIFKFLLPKYYHSTDVWWRTRHSMNVMLGDVLNGMRVVKAFSKETDEISRFSNKTKSSYQASLKMGLLSMLISPIAALIIGLTSQLIWGIGGIEVMSVHMTFGQLTTYLGYTGLLFSPLSFFSDFANMTTETINSANRIFETLDATPDVLEAHDAVNEDKFKGNIKFDKVYFHYEVNRDILKDVSFNIKQGDHVGIVGHTGSGKSTIANLIVRMYDVSSGEIKIDGHNIKELSFDSIRKNIAIVSQEIYLFQTTIIDNIRYGRPNASMDDVIKAAKAANAHDFIMKLPEAYETVVGMGNQSLSGGERQRISIARALLASPSILILDEATAAMDTKTEKLISAAIDKLIDGKTTIAIAHRLSTLKNCDYIMAIENGCVQEQGTESELLEKKGVYYKLYTLQNEQYKKVMLGN